MVLQHLVSPPKKMDSSKLKYKSHISAYKCRDRLRHSELLDQTLILLVSGQSSFQKKRLYTNSNYSGSKRVISCSSSGPDNHHPLQEFDTLMDSGTSRSCDLKLNFVGKVDRKLIYLKVYSSDNEEIGDHMIKPMHKVI